MNDTDNYMCQAANKYWQNAVREIDQFLNRAIQHNDTFGNYEVADRDQLEKLIGNLNTIYMVLEEKAGGTTNWDQTATTYTFSFNELGTNNPIATKNISDNPTMKQE